MNKNLHISIIDEFMYKIKPWLESASTIGETDSNNGLILCTNPSIILICMG